MKVAIRNKFKMAVVIIYIFLFLGHNLDVDQNFCIIVMKISNLDDDSGSIIRFSTIQHTRHLESHHVSTTQLLIEILHIIRYLDDKL